MTIVIAKNAGTILADDDGLVRNGTVSAGGGSVTLNGSLTVGGAWENEGWGYKLKVVAAGNETGRTFTFTGKFYASNSVGDFTTTTSIAGPNASSATSSLYATEVTALSVNTATASSFSVGLAADGSGVPAGLPYGSLYQIGYAGTWGGSTMTVSRYNPVAGEWVALETGKTASAWSNVELPVSATVKAFLTDGSTTTALAVTADVINKTR
jgi:hypothetical protein